MLSQFLLSIAYCVIVSRFKLLSVSEFISSKLRWHCYFDYCITHVYAVFYTGHCVITENRRAGTSALSEIKISREYLTRAQVWRHPQDTKPVNEE